MAFTDSNGTALQRVQNLALRRCPHCNIALPLLLTINGTFHTNGRGGTRNWQCYGCSTCGGVVLVGSRQNETKVSEMYPAVREIDATLPERPREYLRQAQETLAQPAACIVMAASAVDSMLKFKGLKDGSLYSRIDKAAKENLITPEMARWAHQVRLDANDQRHADEGVALPVMEDARRCLDFALALADALFVLPARVTRGLEDTSGADKKK